MRFMHFAKIFHVIHATFWLRRLAMSRKKVPGKKRSNQSVETTN